jgi:hypothetical protein
LKPKLPKPVKGAQGILSVSSTILAEMLSALGVPATSIAVKFIEIVSKNNIEKSTRLLLEQVAKGNIELLTDPDYEGLIPNTIAYYEAAKLGEFRHNLKILALMLIGESQKAQIDPSKVARTARRIASMSQADLQMLVTLKSVFDIKASEKNYDGYHLFLSAGDIVRFLDRPYKAPETEINSQLIDFVSRGLLFIGGNPATIGGHYYYKTIAFDEIIAEAITSLDDS